MIQHPEQSLAVSSFSWTDGKAEFLAGILQREEWQEMERFICEGCQKKRNEGTWLQRGRKQVKSRARD